MHELTHLERGLRLLGGIGMNLSRMRRPAAMALSCRAGFLPSRTNYFALQSDLSGWCFGAVARITRSIPLQKSPAAT
jgi:hypothetical protein